MNENIPALSLRQPWCYAILSLGKSVENRTWSTRYRGRIRLHASQTWDADGEDWLVSHGFRPPSAIEMNNRFQLGAYLGEVEVTGCVSAVWARTEPERAPWAFGPVCWLLSDPVAYPEPIPGRGYPGLFYPERLRDGGPAWKAR